MRGSTLCAHLDFCDSSCMNGLQEGCLGTQCQYNSSPSAPTLARDVSQFCPWSAPPLCGNSSPHMLIGQPIIELPRIYVLTDAPFRWSTCAAGLWIWLADASTAREACQTGLHSVRITLESRKNWSDRHAFDLRSSAVAKSAAVYEAKTTSLVRHVESFNEFGTRKKSTNCVNFDPSPLFLQDNTFEDYWEWLFLRPSSFYIITRDDTCP